MSRKTSIPPKTIEFDRGIQSYRSCNKDYSEGMRNTTFKEVKDAAGDARIIRESEFAKPYGEQYEEPYEDFWAMEYGAPDLPPWGWDYPDMLDPASRWKVTFLCGIDPCYEKGGSRIFNAKCGWEIVSVEFDPPEEKLGVSFSGTTVTITAAADASGTGKLTITMRAKFKIGEDQYTTVEGTHSGISVSECTDSSALCDDSTMSWDVATSSVTINQSGTATVAILDTLGQGGPYSWSVAGSGFTLDNAVTTGLTNVLNASASACGPADVTVTGCDGAVVTGTVRCTSGVWSGNCAFGPGYPAQGFCVWINGCAGGGFLFGFSGAGLFGSGCTETNPPAADCNALVNCNGTMISVETVAIAAGATGCSLPYAGDFCGHAANRAPFFKYWKCP